MVLWMDLMSGRGGAAGAGDPAGIAADIDCFIWISGWWCGER